MRYFIKLLGVVLFCIDGFGQQGAQSPGNPTRDGDHQALRSAAAADTPGKEAVLRNLADASDIVVATDAVVILFRGQKDAKSLALALVPRASNLNLRALLGVAEATRDAKFKQAIARACLLKISNEASGLDPETYEVGGQGNAGYAAMMLAESGDMADRDLVARVSKSNPHDSGLWLALAKMGLVNSGEALLADAIMIDPNAPRWARLAAAAAIAPTNRKARIFVTDALSSFLQTFGRSGVETILERMSKGPQMTLAEGASFQPGLSMLGILEFLQTPDAERITFEFIETNNQWCRLALGLVAAKRWPDRLLASALSHNEERLKLLSAVSVLHPALLPRVQALMPQAELEKRRSQMLKIGVAAPFGIPAGTAGLVF